jgi:hypothetical protein
MKKYKSKIGVSFGLVAVLTALILIISFAIAMKDNYSTAEMVILLIAYLLGFTAYCFSFTYPICNTEYIIQEKKLLIKCGLYKKKILLNDIVEVIPRKSFGREPALNMQRLYIKYSEGQGIYSIGISPRNMRDF